MSHAWRQLLRLTTLWLVTACAVVLELSASNEDEITAPVNERVSFGDFDALTDTDQATKHDSLDVSASTDITPEYQLVAQTALQPTVAQEVDPRQQQGRAPQREFGNATAKHAGQRPQLVGGLDSAMGYIRNRLASEESFSLRLRQLLAQSSKDSDAKQQQLDALQRQLQTSEQARKKLLDVSLKRVAEEDNEIAKQRARADTVEKKLRNTTAQISTLQKNVKWLRERARTLFSHLGNVTQIGKAMEQQLAAAHSDTAAMGSQLEAEKRRANRERHVPLKIEAQLRKVQADEISEKVRLESSERKNGFLQQRYHALNNRDHILRSENNFLRTKLSAEIGKEDKLRNELKKMKGFLAETQRSNAQLQIQYAESYAATSSIAAPVMDSSSSAPHSSALLALKSDSNSLTSLIRQNRVRKNVPIATQTTLLGSRVELGRDSQGLNNLLQGLSRSARSD